MSDASTRDISILCREGTMSDSDSLTINKKGSDNINKASKEHESRIQTSTG